MPIITRIEHKRDRKRYWIYVDGEYCMSVRETVFPNLQVQKGDEVDPEELKNREKYFWKYRYQGGWEKEIVRLNRVVELIEGLEPRAEARISGFGAGSTELILEHPPEPGQPDISVLLRDSEIVIICVEVSGTEIMRGDGYWVRPDKLNYARNHPEQDIWIILHYAEPDEKFVFIRPDQTRQHDPEDKIINNVTERYVVFHDGDTEVKSREIFRDHLELRCDQELSRSRTKGPGMQI